MNINYSAALFGGLLKLYDDIEDIPVNASYFSSQFMETLKVLIIASFTYASIHNMNLPFMIFIVHCLHYLLTDRESITTDFYHAGMILALLLCMVMFDASQLHMGLLFSIMGVTLHAYLDHIFFPEDYSWKKILWRTVSGILCIISLHFHICIPYDDILLYWLGYFTTSVLLMTHAQSSETNRNTPQEMSDEKQVSNAIQKEHDHTICPVIDSQGL